MSGGIATIDTLVGYALEEESGVKPSDFVRLNRINTVAGIQIDRNNIDASAMDDNKTQYVIGRTDIDGNTFPVTVNLTSVTRAEWEHVFEIYEEREDEELRMWLEIYNPHMDEAFFVLVVPPVKFPLPEIAQNNILVADVNLGINDYIGMGEAIKPMPPFYLLTDEEGTVLENESDDDLFAYIEIEEMR